MAEPRRAEGFSRQAANRLSSSSETRPGSRAALGAEQAWNAWQTDAISSTTIARAVTASAAAIRLESDVFPARAAAVAQPAGQAVGVPFTLTIPSELKALESAARTAVTHVATRAAESLDVPSQIVRSAHMQWRDGVGEATLRLTPENLGEVTISLRVEQGSVFATIRAESAAAMQAIQARQQELQTALEAQGLHLDHLILSTDPDRSRDQQPPQHRATKTLAAEAPARRERRDAAVRGPGLTHTEPAGPFEGRRTLSARRHVRRRADRHWPDPHANQPTSEELRRSLRGGTCLALVPPRVGSAPAREPTVAGVIHE